MSRLPNDDDIHTAIAWLECNEGLNGEADACKRVSDYLAARAQDREIVREANQAGVSPKDLRRKLREAERKMLDAGFVKSSLHGE
jgi:hypothetical protein